MREILFRGQTLSERTGKKIWIEGYLILCGESAFIIRTEDMFDILKDTNNEYYDSWSIRGAREVIPETVGQFTGLRDKNNVRIFDGDIIRVDDTANGVVEYEETLALYMAVFDKTISDFGYLINQYPDVEVIGNVHDNPELR